MRNQHQLWLLLLRWLDRESKRQRGSLNTAVSAVPLPHQSGLEQTHIAPRSMNNPATDNVRSQMKPVATRRSRCCAWIRSQAWPSSTRAGTFPYSSRHYARLSCQSRGHPSPFGSCAPAGPYRPSCCHQGRLCTNTQRDPRRTCRG